MTKDLTRENQSTNGRAGSDEKFITPVASINETADAYTIQLEMPGVNKDSLEIAVENNELSITGRRNQPAPHGTVLHRESRRFDFRRAFEIDPSIDSGKIAARISHGVVTLTLPKAEEVKPRKIAVS